MKQGPRQTLKDQDGFSLIELLVYMAILGILMTAVMVSFTGTLKRGVQQTSIAETELETNTGLDLLRMDLVHAGFGLPWSFASSPNYSETDNAVSLTTSTNLNDVPTAFESEDSSSWSKNSSDYLIIRASNVLRGTSSQTWGLVGRKSDHSIEVESLSTETLDDKYGVIVLLPEVSAGVYREMLMKGASGATDYMTTKDDIETNTTAGETYAPPASTNDPDSSRYLAYGINDDTTVKRPFNRTDYFISSSSVPSHCAPNTGVLEKATANQGNDNFSLMPIVDCVADFQIVYYLDTDNDGGWDKREEANGLIGLEASEIRDQVKLIRCYILTHEGNKDSSYSFPSSTINVGEVDVDGVTLLAGRTFDLNATIGSSYSNYRWKVDGFSVSPKNLK